MKYKTKLYIFIRASLYSTLTTAILAWQVTSVNAMFHYVARTPDQQAKIATLMLQRGEGLIAMQEYNVRELIGNPDVTPTNRAILAAYMFGVNIDLGAQFEAARNLIGNLDVVPIRRAILAVAMLERNLDLGEQLDAARNLLGTQDPTSAWQIGFTASILLQETDLAVGGQGRAILATTMLERGLDLGTHLNAARDLLGNPDINVSARTRLATAMLNRNVDLGAYLDTARAFISNPNVEVTERARLAVAMLERNLDLGVQLEAVGNLIEGLEVALPQSSEFDQFSFMLERNIDLGAQGRAILAIAMLERDLDLGTHIDAARALVSNSSVDPQDQQRLLAVLTATLAARGEQRTEAVPNNTIYPNITQPQPLIVPAELIDPVILQEALLHLSLGSGAK